jgi:hypothetical protein
MKHKCAEVEEALNRLLDSLCMWERETSRGSTLILIPHEDDEEIITAMDGKPLDDFSVSRLIEIAMYRRDESTRRKRK